MSAASTECEETLSSASNGALLKAIESLTHQIHAAQQARSESVGAWQYAERHNLVSTLRARRELVKAEALRRMGGE